MSSTAPKKPGTGIAKVSIVIPTFNEVDNVRPLIEGVEQSIGPDGWEIIFVDDNSPDGTSEQVKAIAKTDRRIRCIRRISRRGLSSAAIEGILSSSAELVAVMDGDLQHDEGLLRTMLGIFENDEADIVVASRFVPGGDSGGLADGRRQAKSAASNFLAKRMLKVELSDPMSGFFMMRRVEFDKRAHMLIGSGFKVLLDILTASQDKLRVVEIPMVFRKRGAGASKLDLGVQISFAMMLIERSLGSYIPRQFVMFSIVGATGVGVHFTVLKMMLVMGATFSIAQALAAFIAMTTNFLLNNAVTFRNRSLQGHELFLGLLSFYAVCSVGLIGNVGVATLLFDESNTWWLSGLAGVLVSAVWNYAASSILIWRRRTR